MSEMSRYGKRFFCLALFLIAAGLAAWRFWPVSPTPAGGAPAEGAAQRDAASRILWTDVTAASGIAFKHEAGARGKMFNPETFGSGCGWFDHDGDGLVDLLFINSNLLEGELDPDAVSILYKNLGDGRFEDVTERAGLNVPLYGMGFVTADVDDDGDQDLLLYGLHRTFFFINDGDGKFHDNTKASGLENLPGWICSAAYLDYDRDGKLDLYIGNYVQWTPECEDDIDCTFGTPTKKYCPVAVFSPSHPQLFRGRGDGTFQEVTEATGLSGLKSKSLGLAVEDYDRDGYPDIFVANDAIPNFLLHNLAGRKFEDRGIDSGFATDADGAALAGMGIDTAWAPQEGPLFVAIGNFSGEPATFHVQEETDYFLERSLSLGVGRQTFDRVTFGLLLFDADLDSTLDLFLVNGHVFDVEDITGVPYRQKPQLFLGRSWKKFDEVRPSDPGHFLNIPIVGRSGAYADFDGDGDLDLAVTVNQGAAMLLRNDLPDPKRYVRVDLRGTRSNRDGIGAEVTLSARGPQGTRSVRRARKAVSSYQAQSERQITFGLRPGETTCDIEVLWPLGRRERFANVPLSREVLLVEGKGGAPAAPLAMDAERRGPGAAAGGGAKPVNPVILRRRAVDLYRMAKYAGALEGFQKVTEVLSDDFVAHRFELMSLFRLGRRDAVDAKAIEIARVFPDSQFLVSHFALVLRESGYVELAGKIFREALRINPRRVDVWIALGNIAFDRKDFAEAFRCYSRARELKPDSLEAIANIGKIYTIRKDYARAVPLLEEALALRPDYATALSTLGGAMIELRKFHEAEVYLTRALQVPCSDETKMTIHGNLGILYFKLGDRARARKCFEKVLELEPSDRQARAVLERLKG